MKNMRAGKFRIALVSLALGALALAGCSAQAEPEEAAPSQGAQEVLASSMTELFQQYLDGDNLTDFEREVLERAMETGEISQADYDEAFSRYIQCTTDLGYEEKWTKLPSGLYQVTPQVFDSQEDVDKYAEQSTSCADGTIIIIESLFNQQQNNPDLLADPRAIAVQCLLEGGFIDASYTVDDFDRDMKDPGSASFDASDPDANACLYAAGYAISVE